MAKGGMPSSVKSYRSDVTEMSLVYDRQEVQVVVADSYLHNRLCARLSTWETIRTHLLARKSYQQRQDVLVEVRATGRDESYQQRLELSAEARATC
ncbi:hypothetical protein J6590_016462 [Homalodisca vitripennis]|nr:hypothetical protein J6590_016462 [Homalodisca vitripennis]